MIAGDILKGVLLRMMIAERRKDTKAAAKSNLTDFSEPKIQIWHWQNR
jgi:hypothetical protein